MSAALSSNLEELDRLIDAGADVNVTQEDNLTAAHFAIESGCGVGLAFLYPVMSRELKEKKCTNRYSCLQHSTLFDSWFPSYALNYLYKNGEDPNRCLVPIGRLFSTNLDYYFKKGALCTCFPIQSCQLSVLSTAILNENITKCSPVVCQILQRGAIVNPESLQIPFPLHAAVISGKLNMVKLLLEHGAHPNYPKTIEPNKCALALHTAFAFPAILVELLKAGSDISLCLSHSAKPHCYHKIYSDTHINCLNMIINVFSGKHRHVHYVRDEGVIGFGEVKFFSMLISDEANLELEDWSKAHPTFSQCQCKELVADIDSMSLQHLCRIKVVQLVLEANNWKPLQECLTMLPVPKVIQDFLLYK